MSRYSIYLYLSITQEGLLYYSHLRLCHESFTLAACDH